MNEVMEGKKFYISYNPNPGMGLSFFAGDNNSDETALVDNRKSERGTFYILNGDFRKDYKKLIKKGFNACYKFYLSKKDKYDSTWSLK